MLEDLGLSARVGEVYARLVAMPSASASDMAQALGISDRAALGALDTLERHGLASRTEAGPESRWIAAPPLLTGQRLLVERARRLLDAQQTLVSLAEVHQRTARGSAGDIVEVIIGEHAVHAQVRRLQEQVREEILALVKPPFVSVSHAEAISDAPTVPRVRVVYDWSMFSEVQGLLDTVREAAQPPDQYRIHSGVPMRLQIFDRRVALLPLVRHDAQPALLMVHRSGLLGLAEAFFEAIWREAVPLRVWKDGTAGALPDGEDERVLTLLLAGVTDETIARQLGRSLRWVQRRVRVLMDAAGARTRLQLGWEAHRRGWLGDATDAAQPPGPPVSRADPE